jgi:hypothetical protein
MKSFMILTHKVWLGSDKEVEVVVACCTHRGEKKCMQGNGGGNLKERHH